MMPVSLFMATHNCIYILLKAIFTPTSTQYECCVVGVSITCYTCFPDRNIIAVEYRLSIGVPQNHCNENKCVPNKYFDGDYCCGKKQDCG